MNKILMLLIIVLGQAAVAQKIEFPKDELPNESVAPVLDSPRPVLNRRLLYTSRFEVGLSPVWALDETFYNNILFGFSGIYHISEASGFGIKYSKWSGGYSSYANQFTSLDFSLPPAPNYYIGGTYEYRAFYGKVSVTKEAILPFITAFNLDLGFMDYGVSKQPGFAAGVAQKLYFTPHFGMQLGLNLKMQQAIDPLSQNIRNDNPTKPTQDSFSTRLRIGVDLELRLNYLF